MRRISFEYFSTFSLDFTSPLAVPSQTMIHLYAQYIQAINQLFTCIYINEGPRVGLHTQGLLAMLAQSWSLMRRASRASSQAV